MNFDHQFIVLFLIKHFKLIFFFSNLAIDLLEKMLELDADRRPTAEKALAHKYLSEYADITDEPTADPFDDSFEERDMATNEWKSMF